MFFAPKKQGFSGNNEVFVENKASGAGKLGGWIRVIFDENIKKNILLKYVLKRYF